MNRALPWIIALLISLTANGVMTGLVLHQIVGAPRLADVIPGDQAGAPPPRLERGGRVGGFNIRGFLHSLPSEQRRSARDRFEAERNNIRSLVIAAREAQLRAETALTATPYDAENAAAALSDLRARRFEIENAFERIVLDIVADLPADERLRALEAGRRRPPPPRRGHRPPRGEDF